MPRAKKRPPPDSYAERSRAPRPMVSVTLARETIALLDELGAAEGGRGRVIDRWAAEQRARAGR